MFWQQDSLVEASWNVIAHAQKSDFFFRWNGRVHLNRRGRQFSRLLADEVCASAFIVGSNAGYTMFWGSVKGTGYPLHSPVSPSLPLPCVTVCHHISAEVYIHMPYSPKIYPWLVYTPTERSKVSSFFLWYVASNLVWGSRHILKYFTELVEGNLTSPDPPRL